MRKRFRRTIGLLTVVACVLLFWQLVYRPIQLRNGLSDLLIPSSPSSDDRLYVYKFESRNERFLVKASEPLLVQGESTKFDFPRPSKLVTQGRYRVSAGFDLSKHLEIEVSTFPLTATIVVAPPEIYSIEDLEPKVLGEERGLVNPFSAKDHAGILNDRRQWVHRHAVESGILDRARANLEQDVKSLAADYGAETTILVRPIN